MPVNQDAYSLIMILHHYTVSPYSEMIRLMLGYTGLNWQSSIVPPMPPRPSLDPIIGGYRRIPVAQIGSDLYCDTRLISAEIALLSEKPELSFQTASNEAANFATKVHQQVFMAVVQSAAPRSVLAMLVTRYWPWQIAGLLRDRVQVGKQMKGPRVTRAEREQTLIDFKRDLEEKLTNTDFLFDDYPSVADFAAYHLVWFADLTRPTAFLTSYPYATAWQQRMAEFSQGQPTNISKTALFQITKESQPKAIEPLHAQHPEVGKNVSIQPADYADDATTGTLVAADPQRWVIAKHTSQFGAVHVHFPVHGYTLAINN